MFADLVCSRELAWRFLHRNLSAQYRQSFVGFFWALYPAVSIAVVFTVATESKLLNLGKTDIAYPAYLVLNTVLWQLFLAAYNSPIQALLTARGLLSRVQFPVEAMILARLGEAIVGLSVKIVLLVAVLVWFKVPLSLHVLWVPVVVAGMILLGITLGLLLAPFLALSFDLSRLMGIITGLWFFITPVVYPVPEKGFFAFVVKANPVTPFLVTVRELIVGHPLSQAPTLIFWTITLVALLPTWAVFRAAVPFIVERQN